MNVLKNKHFVVAMVVAPVLAVLAWFALDILVGERPQPAAEGQSYPLVERSGCRYASGRCELVNGDFELHLAATGLHQERLSLSLTSVFPLDGVMIALVEGEGDDAQPTAMQPRSGDGLQWSLEMARPDPERHRLRLAASSAGSLYFGDAATTFTLVEGTQNEGS